MITTSRHVHRQSLIQSYTSTGGYIRCRNELHPYIYPWYSSTFLQSDQSYPHPSTFPQHLPNISPTFSKKSIHICLHICLLRRSLEGDLGQRATRTGPGAEIFSNQGAGGPQDVKPSWLWLSQGQPWKDPPIFKFGKPLGKPSISINGPSIPWRTVSHNQGGNGVT